jgi:DNA-binding transcriptional MerR regulator
MSKNMPQIALDFGSEPSPPPQQKEVGELAEPMSRQYMSAGVGVRIKSLKSSNAVSGDLFANGPGEAAPGADVGEASPGETTAPLAEVQAAAPEAEVQAAAPEAAQAAAAQVPTADVAAAVQPVEATAGRTPRRTGRVARAAAGTATPKAVKSKRGRKSLKQVSAEADLIEIPADDVLFSKQYYTMGEVSEMFRVNQSLLRFWETEFDILQPRKNKKGDRYFRPVDIKNLHLIYHLLRQRKYTIEGAKDFLKKNKKAEERFEAIQRLQEIRAFLQEWKGHLDY